jgi:hypothetical protein
LVVGVNAALQVLVGFYVAALAAIATFNSPSLDQTLADNMSLREGGTSHPVTRREMLSYLFGYLSCLGFAVMLAGLFVVPIRFLMTLVVPLGWFRTAAYVVLWLYISAIWSLFFTTLLGLYYMVYRMHRADPTVLTGAGVRTPSSSSDPI